MSLERIEELGQILSKLDLTISHTKFYCVLLLSCKITPDDFPDLNDALTMLEEARGMLRKAYQNVRTEYDQTGN